MESPTATTASFSEASFSYAPSTVATQSAHVTLLRSCQRVPWPGSSGISTAYPRAARSSAHGRIDTGLPVNPCCDQHADAATAGELGSGRLSTSARRGRGRGGPPGPPRKGIFTAHQLSHAPRREVPLRA